MHRRLARLECVLVSDGIWYSDITAARTEGHARERKNKARETRKKEKEEKREGAKERERERDGEKREKEERAQRLPASRYYLIAYLSSDTLTCNSPLLSALHQPLCLTPLMVLA